MGKIVGDDVGQEQESAAVMIDFRNIKPPPPPSARAEEQAEIERHYQEKQRKAARRQRKVLKFRAECANRQRAKADEKVQQLGAQKLKQMGKIGRGIVFSGRQTIHSQCSARDVHWLGGHGCPRDTFTVSELVVEDEVRGAVYTGGLLCHMRRGPDKKGEYACMCVHLRQGDGKMIFPNGDEVSGYFSSNRFSGHGRLEAGDGVIFEGQFINAAPEGYSPPGSPAPRSPGPRSPAGRSQSMIVSSSSPSPSPSLGGGRRPPSLIIPNRSRSAASSPMIGSPAGSEPRSAGNCPSPSLSRAYPISPMRSPIPEPHLAISSCRGLSGQMRMRNHHSPGANNMPARSCANTLPTFAVSPTTALMPTHPGPLSMIDTSAPPLSPARRKLGTGWFWVPWKGNIVEHVDEDGGVYTGDFDRGMRNGFGKIVYANGNSFYEGEWLDGQPHPNGNGKRWRTFASQCADAGYECKSPAGFI